MVRDISTNQKESAQVLAGAIQIVDWLSSGDSFEGYALKVLGLLDNEFTPIQDYISRDSDTQEKEIS